MENNMPIGRRLSIIGKLFLGAIQKDLNHLEIERDFYALFLINKHDHQISQKELSEMLEVDKVTMVRTIDYLSEKGYVIRNRSHTDKRMYLLSVTPKGKQAVPAILEAFKNMNQRFLEGVSDAEAELFFILLEKMKNNLRQYHIKKRYILEFIEDHEKKN